MAVGVGTRIGPYEVTALLGEGGMGVVFRARDTKLQRDVAVKILPDHLAHDAGRLKRFEREAQILASLNHPHIAHVYGLEPLPPAQTGDVAGLAIAMELVERDTLAARLAARGPLPADEAASLATQIASALDAAHERGIVHRDLKPANITLTPDGTVKVLDFGLAKDVGIAASSAALSQSPTMMAESMPGVIMGTLAYMAPEQARGKTVDARADIWAFGCVLFEMLSGRSAFEGETATDVIARIVSGEPDWGRLPSATPHTLRQLLRVTLAKDPRQRLQHIGDSRLFLTPGALSEAMPTEGASRRSPRLAWTTAAALALLFAATLVPAALYVRGRATPPTAAPVIRFLEQAPAHFTPSAGGNVSFGSLSISPDGQYIACLDRTSSDTRIWIRPIGDLTWRALPGTEGARWLFWSSDSRALGFVADGKPKIDRGLKKVDPVSGVVQPLTDARNVVTAAWGRNGVILFSSLEPGGRETLNRVSDSGGDATPFALDDAIGGARAPFFLPDGRHVLYHVYSSRDGSVPESLDVHVKSLDTGPARRLMTLNPRDGDSPLVAFTAPGYLVFTRNGTLMAQRFDTRRLATVGTPVAIAENVGPFATSGTGVLAYADAPAPGGTLARSQLAWFDRTGTFEPIGAPSTQTSPRLAPGGERRRVVFDRFAFREAPEIHVLDLARTAGRQLTFDPSPDAWPIWSATGDRVLFASSRGTPASFLGALYEQAASGTGEPRLVFQAEPGQVVMPNDWSPTDDYILFTKGALGGQRAELWALPLAGERAPFPIGQPAAGSARLARFSPDGRWIAYTLTESGTSRIVVRPFPEVGRDRWQVPERGAWHPVWRGDEIFYLSDDGTMKVVRVTAANGRFDVSRPVELFKTPLRPDEPVSSYFDVSHDGRRFLVNLPAGRVPASAAGAGATTPPAPTMFHVVLNWPALLEGGDR